MRRSDLIKLFGDTDFIVEDAIKDLSIVITQSDVKGAIRHDPCYCVAARAINRVHGLKFGAIVEKTRTYIPIQKGKKGTWVLRRYENSAHLEKALSEMDRTGEFDLQGKPIVFKVPSTSKTLAYARNKRANDSKGLDVHGRPKKTRQKKKALYVDRSVRNFGWTAYLPSKKRSAK